MGYNFNHLFVEKATMVQRTDDTSAGKKSENNV
jgi:hypothetical protein